ncbi:Mu transposase C-terminal domain-containing protein [Neorhizobium sp. T786]|uniref:Mu transposase C-terminal domain-containing protein n=1 Tax=Pseudorhizobium xiangyangii TaxID=2883104 RepID=UPI001CFFF262|nr:Mu transposase C-terminal domain-containing protein [Neorhizobium xiangyangii]MCB5204231.1 Mu transposase C-terminal domain-containing protein [Neorhizobium xiangyangii]
MTNTKTPSPQSREVPAPIRDESGKYDHRGRKGFITGCTCLPCVVATAFWMWPPSRQDLVSGHRRVIGSSVNINGNNYGSSSLYEGREVFVCVDPQNSGRALVFSANRERYIGEAICPELSGQTEAGQ